MKTARKILPLLLLMLSLFSPVLAAHAQTCQDSIHVTVDPGSSATWHFVYYHPASANNSVNHIVLTLDTVQYPYVRFDQPGEEAAVASLLQNWTYFGNGPFTGNLDSSFWCSNSYFITPGIKDSFFVFVLQPNPNTPAATIFDSTIVIHWFSYFASASDCHPINAVCSGQFEVIPTLWQGYRPLDTVAATSSILPDCDPSFQFTVYNRSILRLPIDHMIFSLMNPYGGTIRPSEAQPPAGWVLDSATQLAAYFETSTNAIPYGGSVSGFNVGLRAPASQISVPFVWSAYSGGGIMDRDTTLPASVTPCSGSANSSDDTLRVMNNIGCAFNFNLENSHSGEADRTVSPIDKLVLQIATPGVTWSSATAPSSEPQQFCWSYAGLNTQTLFFQTPTPICAQPGGLTWAYGASIDDPIPGELVTIQWSDSSGSVGVSSGTDTFRCIPKPTPDSVFVDALGNCEYRVRVKNAHVPASSIHAVLFIMPASDGTFAPPFSSNAGWASSLGGGGLQFTASGGNGLASGSTDTFYFSTNPKQPNTSWPLTFKDYEAKTNNTITDDTIKNVPGCILPVVMDSVLHVISSNCSDLITIFNHGTSPIDSFIVAPINGGMVAAATIAIPWKDTIQGDSAIFYSGTIDPELSRAFTVTYSNVSLPPIHVEVRTIHTEGAASTVNDTSLECSAGAVSPQLATTPLTLSIAPNPLHDRTDITLTTDMVDHVQMVLLNVLGETEQSVVNQMLQAGEHSFTLDASALPAGTYYLRLETSGQVLTKKLVLEK